MSESMTLAEALPKEQARVRALILQYADPILGGSGVFAMQMMEAALQATDNAVINADTVAMLRCYEELKGYNS